MSYHTNMYGVFAFVSHLADDETLPSFAKKALMKASGLIYEQKPMEALSVLCKVRAMIFLNSLNSDVFVLASEAVAISIIDCTLKLKDIEMVRKALGPWARKPELFVLMLAREAGLKAIALAKET